MVKTLSIVVKLTGHNWAKMDENVYICGLANHNVEDPQYERCENINYCSVESAFESIYVYNAYGYSSTVIGH